MSGIFSIFKEAVSFKNKMRYVDLKKKKNKKVKIVLDLDYFFFIKKIIKN